MKKARWKFAEKLVLCLMGVFVLIPTKVYAEGEVIFEEDPSIIEAYKYRRTETGALFTLAYETQKYDKYLSTLDNTLFADKYGAGAKLFGFNWQKKFNWQYLSYSVGLGYATGSVSGSGSSRLEVTKYKLPNRFSLDGISDEPNWVPFLNLDFWQMKLSESDGTSSFSGDIQLGLEYAIGVSIQISRFDRSSSGQAYAEWGLENTFFDLYATNNLKPLSGEEADVSNTMQLGMGLTLEF